MDLKELEAFINLAKKEGVATLKYESKDVKISVSLPGPANAPYPHPYPGLSSSSALPLPPPQVNKGRSTQPQNNQGSGNHENSSHHKITSPFVGTFYSSPSPGESAYVKIGDKVKKGQTLCIVEAMKIMNEIESDVAGEVVEICVDNESLVEYGQTLYLVRVGG